jgi:hypothetical protein
VTPEGAHLLQVRTRTLNDELAAIFGRWYHAMSASHYRTRPPVAVEPGADRCPVNRQPGLLGGPERLGSRWRRDYPAHGVRVGRLLDRPVESAVEAERASVR